MSIVPEFSLDPEPDKPARGNGASDISVEDIKNWRREQAECARLEPLLLQRLKELKPALQAMLTELGSHWTYEDGFYRFFHGSFKVYAIQESTTAAVELLKKLMPERKLNLQFEEIIRDGTGKEFDSSVNDNWNRETRPMLEAFAHAKFMVEMAVRYADLPAPPQPMPSGYAALLYLFDLR